MATITPPHGAPVPSANQSFPLDAGRRWHTAAGLRDDEGRAINGYVYDVKPEGAAMAAANPYVVNGLYAVGQQIFLGYSQSMADHVVTDGIAAEGGDMNKWNQNVNTNALADSTWNSAMYKVVCQGKSVQFAWDKSQKGVGGLMQDPKFTEAQVQSGSDFLKTYLQYK